MIKIIKHFRRWNIWRKRCGNSTVYKFLVLIGMRKSPTMEFTLLPEEWQEYEERALMAWTKDICKPLSDINLRRIEK